MSKISKTWHGILREEIPWYPTVNEEKCIDCGLCFVTCGRDDTKNWKGVCCVKLRAKRERKSTKFTLVSQEFKDIPECTKKISKLLEDNGIVIVEQKKIS